MPGTPGDSSDRRLPEWYMPPQMVGGHVTGPVLVLRSDRLMMAVRHAIAYPAGVEVEVEAHSRGLLTRPDDLMGPGLPPELRFHVRFADGREAAQDDESGLRTGLGPVLTAAGFESSSGGPDDTEYVRISLWIWPLPPGGPLTLTCSWPSRGLHGVRVALDGEAILAAAREAQPFWTAPDP